MTRNDAEHWDRRYKSTTVTPAPAAVLTDNQHLLPTIGHALDLACGLGGNALWLAQHGLTVEAWDCSSVALEKLQQNAHEQKLVITTRMVDLNEEALPRDTFDLIVVSGFLNRSLCSSITAALHPSGVLAYQTFTQEKAVDDSIGPNNPAYLLAPGELLTLFTSLKPRVYREEANLGDLRNGLRNQAYLLASRER